MSEIVKKSGLFFIGNFKRCSRIANTTILSERNNTPSDTCESKDTIDYVFPYCNFNDEIWRRKYLDYLKSIGQDFDFEENQRHVDNLDIIKYSLRSIDKYLPWINNVYLIVDNPNQVPRWLDTNKVKIITHDMFMPKELLPCFNSVMIEHYISRIPGLGEKFLYGNDDFLAMKPLNPNMFFTKDGKLNISVHKFPIANHDQLYTTILNNSWKFLGERLSKEIPFDMDEYAYEQNNLHAFRPNFRSIREKVLVDYEDEILRTATHIRDKINITNLEIPYYYMTGYMTKKVVLPKRFNTYASIDDEIAFAFFKQRMINDNYYTMVVNFCSDEYVEEVKNLLELKFKNKSRYER